MQGIPHIAHWCHKYLRQMGCNRTEGNPGLLLLGNWNFLEQFLIYSGINSRGSKDGDGGKGGIHDSFIISNS